MTDLQLTVFLAVVLLTLLLSGAWIFAGLMASSLIVLIVGADMSMWQAGSMLRATIWRSLTSWELSAVPVFILMGELFFAAGLSNDLFDALMRRFGKLPGGLLHANVWGCTLFAAISGSSTATMMTIGRVTVPELRRRGYGEAISLGSLAGAGSFGILIPPSIPLIIYGILAEQSVSKLFAAGVLPGLLVAGLYSAYIAIVALLKHKGAVTDVGAGPDAASGPVSSGSALTPMMIIVVVLGGIYSGIVTPSEAAVLGLVVTLLECWRKRRLSPIILAGATRQAVKSSANILAILAAASFLSAAVSALAIPQYLVSLVSRLELSYAALIALVAAVYVLLGMFIDGLSMMVITLPVVLPLIVAHGGDPIWFGVFLVLMIEIGLLTPPVGIHLFVMQDLSGRSLAWTTKAAFPFMLLLVLGTIIVSLFPQISLWLPGRLG